MGLGDSKVRSSSTSTCNRVLGKAVRFRAVGRFQNGNLNTVASEEGKYDGAATLFPAGGNTGVGSGNSV